MDKAWFDLVSPYVKGKRIVIITPAHRSFDAGYVRALVRTTVYARLLECDVSWISMIGQSVIPKARNQLVYDVLEFEDKNGPCIPFLIDSDIGWEPEDFFYQVALVVKHDWPILGANYCKKQLHWDQVKDFVNGMLTAAHAAGRDGKDLSLLTTPARLIQSSFHWAATLPDQANIDEEGVMELYGLPAGFLIIQSKVFRHMQENLMTYQDYHNGKEEEMHEWFLDRHVGPPKKGFLLGEDISFFHHVTKMAKSGEEPWGEFVNTPVRCFMLAKLSHTGAYDWTARSVDDFREVP